MLLRSHMLCCWRVLEPALELEQHFSLFHNAH